MAAPHAALSVKKIKINIKINEYKHKFVSHVWGREGAAAERAA